MEKSKLVNSKKCLRYIDQARYISVLKTQMIRQIFQVMIVKIVILKET